MITVLAALLSCAQTWSFTTESIASSGERRVLLWHRIAIAWAASALLAADVLRGVDYILEQLNTGGSWRHIALTDTLLGMAIITAISFCAAGLLWTRTGIRAQPPLKAAALLFLPNCLVAGVPLTIMLLLFKMPPH